MTKVECQKCGNRWETRKPLDEIDQLRYSNCGTVNQDKLTVKKDLTTTEEQLGPTFDRIDMKYRIEKFKEWVEDQLGEEHHEHIKTKLSALTDKAGLLIDRVDEGLDLEEAEKHLEKLLEEGRNLIEKADPESDYRSLIGKKGNAKKELNRVREQVEEAKRKAEEFKEDHGMDVPEASKFVEEHSDLIADVEHLRKEKKELGKVIGRYESKMEAYQEGRRRGEKERYEAAKSDFRIQYPCPICGKLITIYSDSPEVKSIIKFLQKQGWGHKECHEARRR